MRSLSVTDGPGSLSSQSGFFSSKYHGFQWSKDKMHKRENKNRSLLIWHDLLLSTSSGNVIPIMYSRNLLLLCDNFSDRGMIFIFWGDQMWVISSSIFQHNHKPTRCRETTVLQNHWKIKNWHSFEFNYQFFFSAFLCCHGLVRLRLRKILIRVNKTSYFITVLTCG